MKLLPLLLLLLTASACKKEKTELEKLPDASQTGSGAGAFLLDGHAWLPDKSKTINIGGGSSGFPAQWRHTKTGRPLELTFGKSSDGTGLNIYLPDVRKTGTFQLDHQFSIMLGDRNPAYGLYFMTKSLSLPRSFLTGPTATGSLTITRFDTIAHIVSGTFEMTVKDEIGPETHQLTHGRFDYPF
ncbi:hypothetical protein [Hymenobacter chitinivorans]|uniref:Uncharacterized protein n=1 Tax=Hymenobacter chitinivorans DSM 11115 TaxID=1121954 RepID=A0A2M9B997_9BACT|nr:hypothetical protein [Hymenobacter chitinivorans]PJJ54508.1 hypothetical protein CLV45_2849 [Hymenobacter chitinivorans DSM 11115]